MGGSHFPLSHNFSPPLFLNTIFSSVSGHKKILKISLAKLKGWHYTVSMAKTSSCVWWFYASLELNRFIAQKIGH